MSAATELRHLFSGEPFRRFAVARLVSQLADGMFQAGLAVIVFFDPTHQPTASRIALGFVLLFGPFTIIGPFAGPLLDRWQRQRVLYVGNLIRLGLSGLVAVLMVAHAPDATIYVAALIALSINRFLLAAMAAAIPRVVDDADLLAANALLPTLGTLASLLGAGLGAILSIVAPGIPTDLLPIAALAAASVTFGASSLLVSRIGRHDLGPLEPLDASVVRERLHDLVHGLRAGATYVRQRVTPLQALIIMGAQRFLYGLMFVAAILLSRTVLASTADTESAVTGFTIVLAFAGVGFGLAAIITPLFGHLVTRHRWVVVCLLVGAAGQALLAVSSSRVALLVAAVVVSFAVQGGKIAIDTILQRDTEDSVRGRAFQLHDMTYNSALIAAAGVCALVLPDSGYSVAVMGAAATGYVILAAWYAFAPTVPRPLTTEAVT